MATFIAAFSYLGIFGFYVGDKAYVYAFLVLAAGGFGGLVFSLSDPMPYELHVPFSDKKKINTGFFGHVLAGSLAGGIGLLFIGQILDQDLWKLDLITKGCAKPLFTVFSLSAISGFLGLKLLSRLADKLLDQMARDLKGLKSETEELKRDNSETAADEIATRAKVALIEHRPTEALDYLEKSIKIFETARAWGFMANAWYQLKEYGQAISCVNKAIELSDKDRRRMAVYHWNRACYKSLLKEKIQSIVEDLKKSIDFERTFRDDLLRDQDLNYAREQDTFYTELKIERPS